MVEQLDGYPGILRRDKIHPFQRFQRTYADIAKVSDRRTDYIQFSRCIFPHLWKPRYSCLQLQHQRQRLHRRYVVHISFPDTVEEVVFQKYGDVWQFSPAPYLYSAEPGKEQYLAVHTAIEEREHILSEDTVYFSTAPYNDSLDMVIGNHYFCKIF